MHPFPSEANLRNSTALPSDAWQLTNDAGLKRFLGAAPPPGSGKHNYFIAVHALDVRSIGVGRDASPAFLAFNMSAHTLARGVIVPWWEASKVSEVSQ